MNFERFKIEYSKSRLEWLKIKSGYFTTHVFIHTIYNNLSLVHCTNHLTYVVHTTSYYAEGIINSSKFGTIYLVLIFSSYFKQLAFK